MHPAISVIVPLYKTEQFILKCLNSIQSQTFTDIEIICIDDASPDRSADIVKQCQAMDSRIKLIKHPNNLGLSATRNTGIDIAEGQYIASVDSDDFISPLALEKLYGAALENDCDIVACGLNEVDVKGRHIRSINFGEFYVDFTKESRNIFRLINPSFCNKLWRNTFLKNNKLKFEPGRYYEDLIFTYKALMLSSRFYSINIPLYYYVRREGSIINCYDDKHILDYIYAFDTLKHALYDNNMYTSYRHHFNQMIVDNLDYFATNLLDLTSDNENYVREINRYLRIIMHLKISYILNDDDLFYNQPYVLVEKIKSRDNSNYVHQLKTNNQILEDLDFLLSMPEANNKLYNSVFKFFMPEGFTRSLDIYRRLNLNLKSIGKPKTI